MRLSNKLKFKTAIGHYLVNSWDDVLSLRVCVPEERIEELYRTLAYKCERLRDKLSDFMWIEDDGTDGCITRRWARIDSTIFIPNKAET